MLQNDAAARSPRLITFEGGEGSGKTTQIALLADRLRAFGVRVVVTREPGGCPMAEKIRALLVTGQPGDLESRSEWLLMLAARVEHIRKLIRPALERGDWVLCDRFADSTLAYQGHGRGIDWQHLELMNRFVLGGLQPDLTLLLDIDPSIGLLRAGTQRQPLAVVDPVAAENRFEQEALAFHQRVRAGFLELAQANPTRFRVIDATMDPQQVAAAVWEAI